MVMRLFMGVIMSIIVTNNLKLWLLSHWIDSLNKFTGFCGFFLVLFSWRLSFLDGMSIRDIISMVSRVLMSMVVDNVPEFALVWTSMACFC